MSGSKLLLDTNIIVYLLNGDDTLASFLHGRVAYISFITELELLGYDDFKPGERQNVQNFLNNCVIIDINPAIKSEVVNLRKMYRVKLPDSIIMATSLSLDLPIITSDSGFNKVKELEIIHYDL